MNFLSTSFALIFIAIVALASFWLKEEVINEYKNFTLSNNSGPTFFLKKFDSTKTDEDGNLQSSLEADYMKHFEGQNKTALVKPFYTKYKNQIKHSTVYSDLGEIKEKGEEIILKENAILVRLPTKTKKILKLYTHELSIFSELDIVTSQEAVKMIQEPNIEIDGVGMKYNNKNGTLKLLSNVKVRYEKPKGDKRFKY